MIDKERSELYKIIWGIADEVRGSIDGWDFKSYILGFLFYRYISEDFESWIREEEKSEGVTWNEISGNPELKGNAIRNKGYFIEPEQTFSAILKSSEVNPDENLNEELGKIFKCIEETSQQAKSEGQEHSHFSGLLTSVDLNNSKLGHSSAHKNKSILKIMRGIASMNFPSQKISEANSDIFGDAYEYLIGMYATNAGKSGGEFYTPPEVSELLRELCINNGQHIKKVYDPACGSGSLLLKFMKLEKHKGIKFFGQEINQTTYQLCKMNMYLHGLAFDQFDIRCGDTLMNDEFSDKKFDVVVSNPPYSVKWAGKDDPELIKDERFKGAGVLAPKSKADMAFIQHSIYHLNETGVAAIVCFPGILFREGSEKQIRQWLIEQNFVDAVIQLPPNLFYGTGISACIIVLKTSTKKDSNILFIDASELFVKVKNRNRLEENNVQQITEYYKDRTSVENYSYLASYDEVAQKDFNLSVSAYVIKKEIKEKIDIEELNRDIDETSARINDLRKQIDNLIKNF